MLEQMDTDMVQPELDKDVDLMPQNQEVTPLASPDLEANKVSSDQGDSKILEDNMEAKMHNIYFDESQHRIVQLHRVPTLNVHVSLVEFEEQVIMSDVRRHLATLTDATKAYTEATSSSVRFLIAENQHMAKEIQVAKQGGEQVIAFAREELRRVVIDEVLSLKTVMRNL